MKTKFCLRTKDSIVYTPPLFGLFLSGAPIVLAIWLKSWFMILVGSPLIIMGPIFIYVMKRVNATRFCIDGNDVYIDGWCSGKVDPKKIKGIKIMQMYDKVNAGYTACRYKDGSPIYLMILLREITPKMYNYRSNQYLFERFLGEYIIEEVEYNPDAIRHLKTLNPDIKVFY